MAFHSNLFKESQYGSLDDDDYGDDIRYDDELLPEPVVYSTNVICCRIFLIVFLLMSIFSVSIASIIIGHQYELTPCDTDYQVLGLAKWVFICGCIDVVAAILFGIHYLCLIGKTCNVNRLGDLSPKYFMVLLIGYIIYSLIMIIIGIIEIAVTYLKCVDSAYALCVISIVVVMMKFVQLFINLWQF